MYWLDERTVINQTQRILFSNFIYPFDLGSMKIFFQNIETEEKTVDGEVLGELDQVSNFTEFTF